MYSFLKPISIGKLVLDNRIAYLAMAKRLSREGVPTDKWYDYYMSCAMGGVGLLFLGAHVIDMDWDTGEGTQPLMLKPGNGPFFRRLINDIHAKTKAKVFVQLNHGGYIVKKMSDGKLKKVPAMTESSIDKIHDVINKYRLSAIMAKACGADGVEYQLCHNYSGAQFFSPLFNKRNDEYGCQNLENSLRFTVEAINAIKEGCGQDFPVCIKIQGSDFVTGGITPEISEKAAVYLEETCPVELYSIGGGGYATLITGMSGDGECEEGWKVHIAERMKKAVKKTPVMANDNIRTPAFADRIISEGRSDMIGMGRGMFAERMWVNKVKEGREDELRYCVSCEHCLNAPKEGVSKCTVNPLALFDEKEIHDIIKNGEGRKIAIIGAGPSGLEAAVTLAQRGFKPIIFEANDKIGGMIHAAASPIGKDKFYNQIRYYENMVKKLKIDVRLGEEASIERIKEIEPYKVIVATGSAPIIPRVPGVDLPHVFQARNLMLKKENIKGKSIVVVGAGQTGLEVAYNYAKTGNKVIVIDMIPPIDFSKVLVERTLATVKAMKAGIELKFNTKIINIEESTITVENTETCEKTRLESDIVILSIGCNPVRALYEELCKEFGEVYNIGDSDMIGTICEAVTAGSKIAFDIN